MEGFSTDAKTEGVTVDRGDRVEGSAEESRQLRQRWGRILPAVFVTYSLAYLDRANYGFGAAAGLAKTLHITDKDSSLLSAVFFFGYFAFQIPGAAVARRYSVSRVVCAALVLWGTLAALTGVIQNFRLLVLDRFLLGVAESLIFPVMLHLLTQWFTRSERSRANTFLMLGNPLTVVWMSVVTGILIQKFGWQRTFLLEGLPSVAWGVVWLLLVKDDPEKADWLSKPVALALKQQLTEEQATVRSKGSVRRTLLSPMVLLMSMQYFCWSLGVYGFVLWIPPMVRHGTGSTMAQTGVLAAIPYLAAIPLMLLASYLSDRTLRRSSLVWPFLLASGVAMLASFWFAERNFAISFVGLIVAGACMYAPYGPFFAIIPDRLPRSVTAEVLAMVNSCGALGGFCGSYCVGMLQAMTGGSRAGFLLMALALIASSGLMICLKDPPRGVRDVDGLESI
jgi:sugar phosphate permease